MIMKFLHCFPPLKKQTNKKQIKNKNKKVIFVLVCTKRGGKANPPNSIKQNRQFAFHN